MENFVPVSDLMSTPFRLQQSQTESLVKESKIVIV